MFVIQLLGIMKISIKYPVMVWVDNVGTIFIASNIATISHTKHVDIRYKYLNEYVEDGIVEIVFFLKSAENDTPFSSKT